jgi:hypothetical protein
MVRLTFDVLYVLVRAAEIAKIVTVSFDTERESQQLYLYIVGFFKTVQAVL